MWGLSKKWMEISNILFAKLDQECVAELFLNSIKSKGSLKIMRLHMISWYHTWMLWLKIAKISQKFTHTFLQNEESLKKIHRVEKDSLRSQRIKLGFDFKTFCVGNRHHRLFHVKFWLFLGPFDNFNFSTIVKLTLIYIESELINHRIMDFFSLKHKKRTVEWILKGIFKLCSCKLSNTRYGRERIERIWICARTAWNNGFFLRSIKYKILD